MAWTQTEPTVKSWEQDDTTNFVANYFTVDTKQSIGRTSGKGFAVKVECTVSNGSYGSFKSPGKWILTCTINGSGKAYTTSVTIAKGTVTFYYVDEAEVGAAIVTKVAASVGALLGTLTFAAPKLLGGQFYVNVNGSWKQATAYINVGGSWKEVTPKINVGGTWK